MAAMSQQNIDDTARKLADAIYAQAVSVANLNTQELKAAIQALDAAMTGPPSALTGATVQGSINALLPEPFKSTATLGQKAVLIAYWAMKTASLI